MMLVVSAEDLRQFAKEVSLMVLKSIRDSEKKDDTLLTVTKTCEILGITRSTLWRWQKEKYLEPRYIGAKCRYRMSDVKKLMEGGH